MVAPLRHGVVPLRHDVLPLTDDEVPFRYGGATQASCGAA